MKVKETHGFFTQIGDHHPLNMQLAQKLFPQVIKPLKLQHRRGVWRGQGRDQQTHSRKGHTVNMWAIWSVLQLLCSMKGTRPYVRQLVWLCSDKTFLIKIGGRQDLVCGPLIQDMVIKKRTKAPPSTTEMENTYYFSYLHSIDAFNYHNDFLLRVMRGWESCPRSHSDKQELWIWMQPACALFYVLCFGETSYLS
jgi:hypothetical protein